MPSFHLTAQAKEDLKSIGRYTQETWGQVQRNKYLAALDKSFHRLAETPELGRSCDEIREGYRKLHEGRHVIFYHSMADGIEIVRVLHGSMDIETHLSGRP
jgi:toxin ParE1/3/4